MPWSTPSAVSLDTAQFTVLVPNNPEIRRALRQQIHRVYDPWRWLKEGGLEPDEVCQEIRNRMGTITFVVV